MPRADRSTIRSSPASSNGAAETTSPKRSARRRIGGAHHPDTLWMQDVGRVHLVIDGRLVRADAAKLPAQYGEDLSIHGRSGRIAGQWRVPPGNRLLAGDLVDHQTARIDKTPEPLSI